MNHTTIRLAIIVIAATLMITGTIFYPMVRKQQAYSSSGIRHQVKSNEEAVRSSLQERSQHMDQENQCLRASDKCNNSNVGEQTLGNDNSVTGFTDQSKNVQAVVTPTPTPTPTPIGTPPQGTSTLLIIKLCIPSCPGVRFSITVQGNNPQPSSFTIGERDNQIVRLGTGSFTVTEIVPPGFSGPDFALFCKQSGPASATGIILPSETPSCAITNHPRQ